MVPECFIPTPRGFALSHRWIYLTYRQGTLFLAEHNQEVTAYKSPLQVYHSGMLL